MRCWLPVHPAGMLAGKAAAPWGSLLAPRAIAPRKTGPGPRDARACDSERGSFGTRMPGRSSTIKRSESARSRFQAAAGGTAAVVRCADRLEEGQKQHGARHPSHCRVGRVKRDPRRLCSLESCHRGHRDHRESKRRPLLFHLGVLGGLCGYVSLSMAKDATMAVSWHNPRGSRKIRPTLPSRTVLHPTVASAWKDLRRPTPLGRTEFPP